MRRIVLVLAVAALLPVPAQALLPENPWLGRPFLNFAHQGGELEAPSNTLYAFKTALEKGADVLEMDVHATADGHIVVIHDATVNRTTNGSGRVDSLTLAQIKLLDAADQWTQYRGIATGEKPAPDGYEANDFTIPTLDEVLETFPAVLINVEIKNTAPDTTPYEQTLADLLAAYGRTTDAIVVSFLDHATEAFKLHAPEVSTATGTGETAVFKITSMDVLPGSPNPRYHAMQVPITFEGLEVVTEEFVQDAHANGLAVHVWTINDLPTMEWLYCIGVDGIMTDRPTVLEQMLADPPACDA
jgi:glycerophosphoryl diester phosphodiesterase